MNLKVDYRHTAYIRIDLTVLVPTSISDNSSEGIENGHLTITSAELKDVFDAVIRMIFDLIVVQMERLEEAPGDLTVSAILLVGGFGSSEYLRKEIEQHFGEDVKVIQPVNAWSAVTRGAMLRALQGDIVETRIIRSNYGIFYKTPWDPEVHETGKHARTAAKLKSFDEQEQKYFCAKVMNWYVRRGDEFSKKKVVRFPFYQTRMNLNDLIFNVELMIFIGTGEAPYFVDSDCKVLTTLKADLSKVNPSEFEIVEGSGGNYYKISYEVEMSFEAAISFKLVVGGMLLFSSFPVNDFEILGRPVHSLCCLVSNQHFRS